MGHDATVLSKWHVARTNPGSIAGPDELDGAVITWLPAVVPGTAAHALREAGQWTDTSDEDFDRDDWWFRTTFSGRPGPAVLSFGGLATIADAWLNGEHLLHSENMFLEHEMAVELVESNELVIVFRSLREHLLVRRPRGSWKTRLVEQQQLRWVRATFLGRMPGWMPRCAPVGPWRPVELRGVAGRSTVVRRLDVVYEGAVGVVDIVAESHGPRPTDAHLEVGDHRANLTITSDGARHTISGSLAIPEVTAWFPATHGIPALHAASLVLCGEEGESRHDVGRLGFRQVATDASDDRWGLVINGTAVFCRGVCWVPLDTVRLTTERAQLRSALQRLVDGGCNMVRVTGITVYEQSDFYELCDELGLMVWHDLMFANLDYPIDDEAFRASAVAEIEQFLRMAQAHPSIVMVCGGSEVEQQATMMGVPAASVTNTVGRRLLPELAERLLRGAATVPCSPSGGSFPFQVDSGVSHYYGVGAYLRPLSDARLAGVRFTSECLAFASVPCRQSVDELLADGDRPGHSPAWVERVPRDRGAGWDFEDVRDHYVSTLFGVSPAEIRYSDPDRYLDLGRAAVCHVIESTIAEWRRPSSPCAGALVFLHHDPWLGAGWGVIDAQQRPKSAFDGLARACAPLAVFLHDDGLNGLRASIINDSPRQFTGTLQIELFDVDGGSAATAVAELSVPPHTSQERSVDAMFDHFRDLTFAFRFGPRVVDSIEGRLLDEGGSVMSRAVLLPEVLRRDRRTDTGLWVEARYVADGIELRMGTAKLAQFVCIDIRDAVPDDNWFHLVPGAQRVVRCVITGVSGPRTGELRALNEYSALTFSIAEEGT